MLRPEIASLKRLGIGDPVTSGGRTVVTCFKPVTSELRRMLGGDREKISATVTMPANRKVAGVKKNIPPDDL